MRPSRPLLLAVGLVAAALAAVVAAAVFFAPRISALPWLRSQTRISLVPTRVGAVYTLNGKTARHENGAVSVRGRWNDGAWQQLASTTSTAGHYQLTFKIRRAGRLSLRVTYPGGDATGTLVSLKS